MIGAPADEAIRLANDSEYGLGASIYTKDLATAMRAMESIKAGTFWINDPLTDNDAAPFGGMRHSGILHPRRMPPSANESCRAYHKLTAARHGHFRLLTRRPG